MPRRKPIIAIVYDFDKTLSTTDMQEYGLIPKLKMSSDEFWGQCKEMRRKESMDGTLTYLYQVLSMSRKKECSIRREDFVSMGKDIELFPGVKDWFDLINEKGKELGVNIEHYIVSSGMKEIIEGTPIFRKFKKVFACEYLYDVNGVACWPKSVINYTDKTQMLFRINKGELDEGEDEKINKFMYDEERRIPFSNMIYIGDGMTDVPCMKVVKRYGGTSIAVYGSKKDTAYSLMNDGRIDFICPADYTAGKKLHITVTDIIEKTVFSNRLMLQSLKDRKEAEKHKNEHKIN